MGFTTLGLSDQILQGVHATGYTVPTLIQTLAIQPAVEGRDVIGLAQTGTGKTAAFVLPMLHRLALQGRIKHHHPRAIILTPTRELAQQVHDAVTVYGKYLTLRTATVYGGVGMEPQIKLLRRGVDIVIATPGRLLDHLQRRTIDLSHIETLVLDEADRMLAMGFIQDVRKIVATLPTTRQTMMFSATFSKEINALAAGILRNPHRAEAGLQQKPVEAIAQNFYMTPPQAKMDLLIHVLEAEKMESVLVFARTKHGADKISRRLERKGVNATAIHSNRSQPQRQKALDGFRQGKFRVLVATDIAARGIDVDGISHVINYDIPRDAEDYLHRIGRTGRAGLTGDAVTFVTGEDRDILRRIERFTGKKCTMQAYPGFNPKKDESTSQRVNETTNQRNNEGTNPRNNGSRQYASRYSKPFERRKQGFSPKKRGYRPERHKSDSQPQSSEHAPRQGRPGGRPHGEFRPKKREFQPETHRSDPNSQPTDNSSRPVNPPQREYRPKKRGFRPGGMKKKGYTFGRKKKTGAKMETFSSDQPWRNH